MGPRVLFADEPTSALNSSKADDVTDAIACDHEGGITIIMVTHDPAVVALADRVIYLQDGELIDELQNWLSANGF